MKLPQKKSRLRIVLDVLDQAGPVTVQQGTELHGSFKKLTPADMTALYDELVVLGWLEHSGQRYYLSEAAVELYHPMGRPAPAGPTVPPRTAPPFRPLSARFIVSSRGMREGCDDLRDAPSRYT